MRIVAALALFVGVAACMDTARSRSATVGALAPEYAARAFGGDSVSLDSLRGKVVVLNIWATWCHPCRDEIPVLQALHEKRSGDGLAVVGVSVDGSGSDAAIRDMIRDFGMTYAVWVDPADRISSRFLTRGVPETFIIGRDGVIRWRKIGVIEPNDGKLDSVLSVALAAPR